MNKKGLHSIGDLCKMCGVTRRMVLNFEEHGLIYPMDVDKASGYRYYGAPSAARICHIRSLQKLGFSLDNVKKFLDGDYSTMWDHLEKLNQMKKELEEQISCTRAMLVNEGDFSVHIVTLPEYHCAVITEYCANGHDRFMLLWKITEYVFSKGWQVSGGGKSLFSIHRTNPLQEYYGETSAAWSLAEPNEESVYFPEIRALCVNVKGDYSKLPGAAKALYEYAGKYGYIPAGDMRTAYLTSPQSHANPKDYVTQLFLPIE